MDASIKVAGMRELLRALSGLTRDVEDMRTPFRALAERAASAVRAAVPVHTGALRASVRVIAEPLYGSVRITAPHARYVAYRFKPAGDAPMRAAAPTAVDVAVARLIQQQGFS